MFNFFKKKNIQNEILSDIKKAKESIKVAVSWLTDPELIHALIERKKAGVDVKVLVSSNELNIIRFELFKKLQDLGGHVQKWGNIEADQGTFMHYKFYIIDDSLAKSGSYNWSINARTNAEALDQVDVHKKIREFNELFPHSFDFFYEIDNPETKRRELETIRKEKNQDTLTPETLKAYRDTQKIREEYRDKQTALIEAVERREKELIEKLEKEKMERIRAEKLEAERIAKEKASRYQPKESVEKTTLPPTSYGDE